MPDLAVLLIAVFVLACVLESFGARLFRRLGGACARVVSGGRLPTARPGHLEVFLTSAAGFGLVLGGLVLVRLWLR